MTFMLEEATANKNGNLLALQQIAEVADGGHSALEHIHPRFQTMMICRVGHVCLHSPISLNVGAITFYYHQVNVVREEEKKRSMVHGTSAGMRAGILRI